jgi:hypothetical protein
MLKFLAIYRKYIPLLLIIFLAIAYFLIQFFYMGHRLPVSPDESQALYFSQNLATSGTLISKNDLNTEYSEHIFAARQYVQRDGDTSPSAFLGYLLILAALQAISPILLYAAGPLLAAGSLLFIYLIARRLFEERIAIFSIILTGTFPVFTYWMTSYYNNMAETFFVLATVYFAIRAMHSRNIMYYALIGIFAASAIWIRYTNALLLPVGIIIYAIVQRGKILPKGIIVTLIVGIVSLAPLIVINNALYGSPFKFGQSSTDQLVYDIADSSIPKEILPSLVPFRSVEILATNLQAYLYLFTPAILLLGVLGMLHAWHKIKSIKKEIILLSVLAISWLLYYMGGVYFGYGAEPLLSSSYTRYLLLVYIILIIFFSNTISSFLPKRLQILLVTTICISSVYSSYDNISSLRSQSQSSYAWLQAVKMDTPADSVIFVKGADKVLYPERDTALYLTLSKETKYGKDGISKTIMLMKEILDDGKSVYILKEDDFYTGEPVTTYLNGLKTQNLKVINYNKSLGLYEIGKQ